MNGTMVKLKNILKVLIPVLVVIGLGLIIWFLNRPHETAPAVTKATPNTIHLNNAEKTTSTWQYLPKTTQADPDIEYTSTQKPLSVSINGVKHEIPTDTVKETSKLENGKLVVTEEREVKLDLKVPEQPKVKKGLYYEYDAVNHEETVGGRVSYQTEPFDVDLKAGYNLEQKDKMLTITMTKWF